MAPASDHRVFLKTDEHGPISLMTIHTLDSPPLYMTSLATTTIIHEFGPGLLTYVQDFGGFTAIGFVIAIIDSLCPKCLGSWDRVGEEPDLQPDFDREAWEGVECFIAGKGNRTMGRR